MAHPHTHPQLMYDDCCSFVFPVSGPSRPNQNGHHLQQPYHLQFQQLYHQHEQLHLLPNAPQLLQQPHQFQAFQLEEKVSDLEGDNGDCIAQGLSHYEEILNCRQPRQPQEDFTPTVSSWKTFNKHSDPEQRRQQVNIDERCMVSGNSIRTFGELEALYVVARSKETNQMGFFSAVTGENLQTNASVPLLLGKRRMSTVSATATTRVEHVSEASTGEGVSMRKGRKKIRTKKMVEEVDSMDEFFESLVKRVILHQEGLQNKFLELIERMDKERAEREQAWRRQENEN